MGTKFTRTFWAILVVSGTAVFFQNCTKSEFSNNGQPIVSSTSDNGYPYDGKLYADVDPNCAETGVKTKIRYFSSTQAELVTSNCVDLPTPQMLVQSEFLLDPKSSDILLYQQRTLYAEQPVLPMVPIIHLATPSNLTGARGGSIVFSHVFTAQPMARDFTVFVNFVNSAGISTFFDNHQPPTPTSVWSGPLTYSRTVNIPAGIAPGTYKIVAGVYEFNAITGQYENQALLGGLGVLVDGGPGNFQIGILQVQ
ncbi:MAG: hypothetical protein AB7F86_11955 [Bdellovibrionales bacterium]